MMDAESALKEIELLLQQGKRSEAIQILMDRYALGFHDGKVVSNWKK